MIIGDEQSAEGISNFYGAGMKIGVSPGAPFMRPRRRFSSRQRISIAEVDALLDVALREIHFQRLPAGGGVLEFTSSELNMLEQKCQSRLRGEGDRKNGEPFLAACCIDALAAATIPRFALSSRVSVPVFFPVLF